MKRERLDRLVVARGLASSRERARRLVMAGRVRVNARVVDKPGTLVPADAEVEADAGGQEYVSRGGVKLAGALEAFGLSVAGAVVLDVGASTGGFTDCVLRRGARAVIAVDVGYGQLAWSLRRDPRVTVLERTNVRFLRREDLPAVPDLAVVDVSFISLRLVLPAVRDVLAPHGEVVALVKPQFEVGRGRVGRGGVVRSPALRAEAVAAVRAAAEALGFRWRGQVDSVLPGPKGNREVFLWLARGDGAASD